MELCGFLKLLACPFYMFLLMNLVSCGRIKRIIGGHEISCGKLPRVVALRNVTSQKHLCGATLLSPKVAVTAAHCCYGLPNEYTLHLSNCCSQRDYPTAKVLQIYKHQGYNKYSRAHDIAILSIDLDIEDTEWLEDSILPDDDYDKETVSDSCTIAGYGIMKANSEVTTNVLHAAEVNIITPEDCYDRLGEYMAPSSESGQICAVGVNGSDTCMGDSGGPILCSDDMIIRGISSYGQSCGCPGVPGVYTSILQHINWIKDIFNLIQKTWEE